MDTPPKNVPTTPEVVTKPTSSTSTPEEAVTPQNTGGSREIRKRSSSIMSKILWGVMSFIGILFILAIFTIISQYNSVKANAKNIAKNWPKYRCQPHVMPFAGWLVGPPGISGVENFVECGLLIFKNSFSRFMAPFIDFLDRLLQVVLDLFRSVENIRKMINYLRDAIKNFLTDIGNMLYGYGKKLSYLFNRLLQTFKLMFDTFYYLFYTVAFSIYTVAAVWNSPIGGVGRYFCFRASTPINMDNGTKKAISQLHVGDKLLFGGRVLATMKFPGKTTRLYAYPAKDDEFVFVSGDHLVCEGGRWIRVCDSQRALETNDKEDEIYCLVTERARIYSNGVLFSDFQEAETDQQFRWIRQRVLDTLNGLQPGETPEIKQKADHVWGIEGSLQLTLRDGSQKRLDELQLGDQLDIGGTVEGLIEVSGMAVDQYLYRDVVCSGDMIIKEDGKWVPIRTSMEAVQIQPRLGKLYQLLTSENIFNGGTIIATDFDQTLNDAVNSEIDSHVERYLNKGITLPS